MKAAGLSVLLVEQNVRFARDVADRHHIVAHGRVEQVLTSAELAARESDLLEYLGV
jgi:branched-chain amino acid transport system ATP-binding protein